MPISKEEKALYPPPRIWKMVRLWILARAGDCCEGTDRFPRCREANRSIHSITGSKVVLTIAHLDHDPKHNDPKNLRALCQRCHLDWDRDHHMRNAAETRLKKRKVKK